MILKPRKWLLQGDCLEIMPRIRSRSVDLILTDLPYGITDNKWDSAIPLEPMWREFWRVCRGPVVLTAAQPFTSVLVMSQLSAFKYDWVWEKPTGTGFLNAKKMPLKNHESILVFGGNTYYPQMRKGKPYTTKQGYTGTNYEKKRENYVTINDGTRYPLTVNRFGIERGLHPTQKPVALMEYLIKTYTRPGAIVLDATMGSGTTGVACMNTGRLFIGIERDPDYFKIASERM